MTTSDSLEKRMRDMHKEKYPHCTYRGPHYVPPSLGQVGFYLCDPPADLTNHSRCRPSCDHGVAE